MKTSLGSRQERKRIINVIFRTLLTVSLGLIPTLSDAALLPSGFVYLRDIAPSIVQEMRYAGTHNFVGRPIKGYLAAECILTTQAAQALARIQQQLVAQRFSLKVYDCYRPVAAVADFVAWSKQPMQQHMKSEFYPTIAKSLVFELGYLALRSEHSRGSAVDLTLVPLPAKASPPYQAGTKLVACFSANKQRYPDTSIDMGTGYDCFDERTHWGDPHLSDAAQENRLLLRNVMQNNGFLPYEKEWWHFTLANEPFADRYFTFPIRSRDKAPTNS